MKIFESKTVLEIGDLVMDVLTKEKGLVIEILRLKDDDEAYYRVHLQNPILRRYTLSTYSRETLRLLSSAS